MSLKYKFLFKHVPRVAGKSIMSTLTPYSDIVKAGHADMKAIRNSLLHRNKWRFLVDCETPDMEQVEIYGRQLCIKEKFFKMSQEEYDELFTFAFVRNPYGRELSRYLFIGKRPQHVRYKEVNNRTFEQWLKYLYDNPNRRQNQLDMLTDKEGKMIITFVGKYENLEGDFKTVCSKVGLPADLKLFHIDLVGMEHLIRKDYGQYKDYFTDEAKKLVREICKKDIEYFGYEF